MIIGAGVEQVPAYELAKARGFKVVGTDLNPNAPGLKIADYALHVSTKDAQSTVKAAEKFNKLQKIDGVMTIANDVPFTVALVAKKLGLNSISLDAAMYASNKLAMKNKFLEHGVECPWFSEISSISELEQAVRDISGQNYVLKPVDGSGARGVVLIDESTNLNWAFKESMSWSDTGVLIIEKFIEGMQLSTESFLINGKCYTPGISERNYSKLNDFRPYIIENGGTIPAQIKAPLRKKITSLILRGAASMGIDKGIVKGDIVIDKNGQPMIIELAARLSGGWFSTHQIPLATGVNLVNAVISESLGIPLMESEFEESKSRATAIRYFFPPEGEILSIDGLVEMKNSLGVRKYGFFRGVGDFQPKVLMHPDRFGYVLVEASNRDEAVALVEQAMSKLKIEIKKT
jgi:biotin carboxylase